MPDPRERARWAILGAAALFSTGGAAIKATTLTSWQVACFRSAIAAVALLAVLPSARRRWSWRMAGVAVAYAATLIGFVTASKLTTAANAIFLQATAPLYLALSGPLLLRERLRRFDMAIMAAMGLGLALFFSGPAAAVSATAPDPVTGNIVGALTGLTWAATLAGLRFLSRANADAGIATAALGNIAAAALAAPFAFPLQGAQSADWLAVGYLGVFQVGLAYFLLTRGIRRVPALEASLLILVEPALSPVWAGLLHGEWPGGLALAGGALILAATVAQLVSGAAERSANAT